MCGFNHHHPSWRRKHPASCCSSWKTLYRKKKKSASLWWQRYSTFCHCQTRRHEGSDDRGHQALRGRAHSPFETSAGGLSWFRSHSHDVWPGVLLDYLWNKVVRHLLQDPYSVFWSQHVPADRDACRYDACSTIEKRHVKRDQGPSTLTLATLPWPHEGINVCEGPDIGNPFQGLNMQKCWRVVWIHYSEGWRARLVVSQTTPAGKTHPTKPRLNMARPCNKPFLNEGERILWKSIQSWS